METNYSPYILSESLARIDEILAGKDAQYEDRESIPGRNELTFDNGFNCKCTALFVDMRNSKALAESKSKPSLAKLYRAYISELVAVFKGNTKISEITIEGDCVWGVFDTPYKSDINEVFATSFTAASLVDILNYKLRKVGSTSAFNVGIGMAYGEALVIKAGFKNSGINEATWIGRVVGEAARLCSFGNRTYTDFRTMISAVVYANLSEANQRLLSYNQHRDCYHGNIIQVGMEHWLTTQG
ncbi:MAG TPA: adenylate/guanylate cyclase domain-containing protein [Verrucomicrobiae bacterium]